MGRKRQNRIISDLPSCQGFKPIGKPINKTETNILLIEEFEAIRLLDYDGLSQEDASIKMGISRPTLTRIYMKARKTIANSIVEGKIITIGGGNFEITGDLNRCPNCRKLHPKQNNSDNYCIQCKP